MKKQNFSTLVKRSIFSLGFTGFLLIGATSVASAQTLANSPNANVKYIGALDGQPVFRVQLDNQAGDIYHLTIKDDSGNILYAEKIRDKQFSKKFKFENSDRENVKLTFILQGKDGSQAQQFKVNSNTRVWNDVVVTTL